MWTDKTFVYSIGQDVRRVVSQGRWKLSKHILICAPWDISTEVSSLQQFWIDSAIASRIPLARSSKDNLVFHSEWDNLNKVLPNVTGPNVVNSTAGIMLQEQKKEATSSAKQTRAMLERSKERSLKLERPTVLPPKVIYKRTGPVFPEAGVLSPPPANDTEYSLRAKEHLVWFLCR